MNTSRLLLLAISALALVAQAQDAPAPNPQDLKPRPAEMAPLAAKSLLLALAKTGDGFVAVGNRGVILVSADGEKWEQVASPVQATLTTVSFADGKNGWAAGHDASILHTADGGRTWTLQNFQPELNKPVLSLLAIDEQHAFAAGAYGLFLTTSDGGGHWTQVEAPTLLAEGPHLNSMIKLGNGELFIAGETGLLGVSGDGTQWTRLKLPYAGSLFGALARGERGALVYGLRGNVLETDDVHTNNWRKIDAKTVLSFFGGARLANGDAVLVGADGEVLRVTPAGVVSPLRAAADERTLGSGTLSGVLPRDGEVLVVGESGVGKVKVAEAAAPAAAEPAPIPAAAEPAPRPAAPEPAPPPIKAAPPVRRAPAAPARHAAATPARPTTAASPAKAQDGADVKLTKSLALHPRPMDTATSTVTLRAGTPAKLKSHLTNPTGVWWYVSSPSGSGWVTDAELKARQ